MNTNSNLENFIAATAVKRSGENIRLNAKTGELSGLADRLAVLEVTEFAFEGKVSKYRKSGIKLTGHISASVFQECIASLEPVSDQIETQLERYFLPEAEIVREHEKIEEGELILDPEGPEDFDELQNGGIDLWDVLIEETILSLNPYPRHPDYLDLQADKDDNAPERDPDSPTHRPFSNLNALINEKKSKN